MIIYKGIQFDRMDELSNNQKEFVDKALELGLEIDEYSGRGMYGTSCPSVTVKYKSDFPGAERKYQTDNMGLDWVIYAQY